jgi:hypothetical protein
MDGRYCALTSLILSIELRFECLRDNFGYLLITDHRLLLLTDSLGSKLALGRHKRCANIVCDG